MRTGSDTIVSLGTAVSELVHDGDTVALEGFTHLIPIAAGQEIIRQRRRDLTLVRMTPDIVYDQLIGAGCARKLDVLAGAATRASARCTASATRSRTAGRTRSRSRSTATPGIANRYVAAASGPPVRGHARLQRHRPARAHAEHQADHLPVHRRGADRGAGARPRRRDHPRPARRPRGQRADVGPDRGAEGGGAGRQALAGHRRGDRRRARAACRARVVLPKWVVTDVAEVPGGAHALLRAGLLRARQRLLPRVGRASPRTRERSSSGWRRYERLHDRRDDGPGRRAGAAGRRRLLRRHRAARARPPTSPAARTRPTSC